MIFRWCRIGSLGGARLLGLAGLLLLQGLLPLWAQGAPDSTLPATPAATQPSTLSATLSADPSLENNPSSLSGTPEFTFSPTDTAPILREIRLAGLHYLSPSQVFGLLSVRPGSRLDDEDIRALLKRLESLGLFRNFTLYYDDSKGLLTILLKERPIISKIDLTGNKMIPTDKLLSALRDGGIDAGKIYKKGTLERIREQILSAYEGAGRFGTSVEYTAKNENEDAVSIVITIKELSEVKIEKIRFVGNDHFSDDDLKKIMKLSEAKESLFSSSSVFSDEVLEGDLSRIELFYKSQGYLDFEVLDHQIAASPSRRALYLTLSLSEGQRYRVSGNTLNGKTVLNEGEVRRRLFMKQGEFYSQKEIDQRTSDLEYELKSMGYLDAKVTQLPEKNEEAHTALLKFSVDPGREKFVRRVLIEGNTYTADPVLRREIRQQEAAPASQALIDRSVSRIQAMGEYSDVTSETRAVQGSPDAVDIVFVVKERPRTQFSANLQYGTVGKFGIGFAYAQRNILGTGYDFSVNLNADQTTQSADLSLSDPFLFRSSVTMDYFLSLSRYDNKHLDEVSNYAIDSFILGAGVSYPVSDYASMRYALSYDHRTLHLGTDPTRSIDTFVKDSGKTYNNTRFSISYSSSHLDKGYLPTQGYRFGAGYELTLPWSSTLYHQINAQAASYLPFDEAHKWILSNTLRGSYGRSYGKSKHFPFFESSYLGGLDTVRGFEEASLGPRDKTLSGLDGGTIGGNGILLYRSELVVPILKDQEDVRTGVFVDVGTLYNDQCTVIQKGECDNHYRFNQDIYASMGLRLTWYTAIAPISISYAVPIRHRDKDPIEHMQFAIGMSMD